MESVWGWAVLWVFVWSVYLSLDEKYRECQKQQFLATTPCPRFTLQEPTYEPPDEHRAPPPRRAPKLTSDLALATLGLTRSATLADVKSAYREQMRQYLRVTE